METREKKIADSDYPALYQAADSASLEAQGTYTKCIYSFLILLVLAAIASLFSGDSRWFAILSAALFIFTLIISLLLATKRYDRTWYKGRAVAESTKTRVWRYMMRTKPYDEPDAISRSSFLSDLTQILNQNRDLCQHLPEMQINHEQITSTMEAIRRSSLEERMSIYENQRVDDQRTWYAKKAGYNRRMSKRWFILMCAFQLLAIVSVLIRIAYPGWDKLPTEVLAVAAASVLSWMQVKRFQELSTSYNFTAQEIGMIKGALQDVRDEEKFSDFVSDAENAFSREHTQWLARRDV
ncbi:hypothetical protein ES703_98627 [subsurface metagenome]